jgi:hypothetical protein
MNISVKATQKDNGSVHCLIECDGQEATLVFDGKHVSFEVPEPAQGTT